MKRLMWGLTVMALLVCILPVSARGAQLQVEAKSAVLMEAATGTVLYAHNAHEPLPPASVTKVMTMLLIMEAIRDGRIGWEDTVTTSEAAAGKGGSQVYLKVGETMSVTDMVKAIAVSSANDCACAMAEHIAGSEAAFVDRMNQRAEQLEMADTHFVNCTGLDDHESAKDHKTSAHDIALMSRQLLVEHPDIKQYTTIWMDTIRNGEFGLSNTNKMVRFYPGATGLKTGFTSQAGYCLSATAERDGMELIAVVMGCQTPEKRIAACKAMLDHGFANYAVITPQLQQEAWVPVKLGAQTAVRVVPGDDSPILMEKGQKAMVTTELTLDQQAQAPVSQGQRLGTMTVKAGQQVLRQIPLVAEDVVRRLSFGQIFRQVLRHTFGGK